MPDVIRVKETEDHRVFIKLYGKTYEIIVEKYREKKVKDDDNVLLLSVTSTETKNRPIVWPIK